jgi:hypothetical protein
MPNAHQIAHSAHFVLRAHCSLHAQSLQSTHKALFSFSAPGSGPKHSKLKATKQTNDTTETRG